MTSKAGATTPEELPAWYPIANATDEEIRSWLTMSEPPVEAMREALPWLRDNTDFVAWLNGVREAKARNISRDRLLEFFPGIANIPLPPRLQQSGN